MRTRSRCRLMVTPEFYGHFTVFAHASSSSSFTSASIILNTATDSLLTFSYSNPTLEPLLALYECLFLRLISLLRLARGTEGHREVVGFLNPRQHRTVQSLTGPALSVSFLPLIPFFLPSFPPSLLPSSLSLIATCEVSTVRAYPLQQKRMRQTPLSFIHVLAIRQNRRSCFPFPSHSTLVS
jgi:hypothetical protein